MFSKSAACEVKVVCGELCHAIFVFNVKGKIVCRCSKLCCRCNSECLEVGRELRSNWKSRCCDSRSGSAAIQYCIHYISCRKCCVECKRHRVCRENCVQSILRFVQHRHRLGKVRRGDVVCCMCKVGV